MKLAGEFGSQSHELAKRFLRTAVVVDDEAYMNPGDIDKPKTEVVTPGRHAPPSNLDDRGSVGLGSIHTLDAGSIVESFSALGIICGVVGPKGPAMAAMRQADIVILDWLLQDGNPGYTLQLLRELLDDDADRNSLRLVAIYTGEAQLQEICATVAKELTNAGLEPKEDETKTEISYRHGRLVFYAKSNVNLEVALRDRSVSEEAFPEKLVDDFASMTGGLLPGIALASLTAVREGEHMVLDRFHTALDPAFLGHRTCLPSPEDAERQIVNYVAEELRGLMDNTVAEASPAGANAVESWIRRKGDEGRNFTFKGQRLDLEQTISLANKGFEASGVKNIDFRDLTAGFAGSEVVGLDEKLAWIMSFRTVYNRPPPILWLGTVVTELPSEDGQHQTGDEKHLICMRPRCDCVRLKGEALFFFLPLTDPQKDKEQIVVRIDRTFKRMSIKFDSSGWIFRQFEPLNGKDSITPIDKKPDDSFEFEDPGGTRYRWRGELKAEYAQRIAQNFAATLTRVAVDESEWLRRRKRKG